ncbi:hypothetical protein H0H92_015399 [Tricholoma furcatifolium]|nr:hypothetical protein H0H92_015399 [Tricholoma furcatifolium]
MSGPGPTRPATILPDLVPTLLHREAGLCTLNTAIQTINIVHDLVPISMAKGVLAAVAGILGIVKTTIANQGDFAELAEQCQTIGLTVWRATSGTPEHQIKDPLRRSLAVLKKSVNNLQTSIEREIKKNLVSQVFNVIINQETITKWRMDMDRSLTLFNTELNISMNLKLDDLLVSFEQLRKEATLNLHVLVGRDDLIGRTSERLIQCHDVALIGPGGIGKSSIARAVVNDDGLAAKFLGRRLSFDLTI